MLIKACHGRHGDEVSTLIDVNQLEYHEEQPPSSPQPPIMLRKTTGQKTSRYMYCVKVIVSGLKSFLCAISNDAQQTLALTYTSHKKFSEGKQVHVGMEASKTNQTR